MTTGNDQTKPPVYLDYNATTPLSSRVTDAISRALVDLWGNPSSSYGSGEAAKRALEEARSQVGLMVGAANPQSEVTFTSGGTESNWLAMHSAIEMGRDRLDVHEKPHVVTTNIEHVATEKPLRSWMDKGLIDVTFVPVNVANGQVDVQDVMAALRPTTVLVTLILANNETGVIQPVHQLGVRLKDHKALLHTDAAQAFGKIRVSVDDLGVDFLTIVGHKFYGPRVGALYHRPGFVRPLFLGGGQEMGRRAGTENVAMIVGLGAASLEVCNLNGKDYNRLSSLRLRLYSRLKEALGESVSDNFGQVSSRLPNTLSVSFKNVSGAQLLVACGSKIEASTGAACHSSVTEGSQILVNSGLTPQTAMATVRLSVGAMSSFEEMDRAAGIIAHAYSNLTQ